MLDSNLQLLEPTFSTATLRRLNVLYGHGAYNDP